MPSASELSSPIDAATAVLAFVADTESGETLRTGLRGLQGELDIRRGTLEQAIRHLEKEAPPGAIIVDITGADNAQAGLDDLSRVCPPDVQVFVIGGITDITFYRLLVDDLGVTEYLPKPLTRDAVQRQILQRLNPAISDSAAPRGGQLIAVCGARGGVGASTIAASLALELAGVAKGHVALLDLHLQGGTIALMLSGSPGVGLRLALEDGDRADNLFLERTAITVAPRLQMIAAQEPLDAVMNVNTRGVERLIALLQRKFNYIIVDLPMPLPPVMSAVIEAARHVVVVMEPDLVSLRNAKEIRSWVTGITGGNRSLFVLNRADMKGGLGLKLIEKGLGAKPEVTMPDLGRKMVEAVNLGVAATKHVPALKRLVLPLVREVAGVQPSTGGRSLLRRVFKG